MSIIRKAGACVALTSSLLLAGGALAGPASAAPPQQDGLINVNISGNEFLNDVNIGVAVAAAVELCGTTVKNVGVLAVITDRSGATTTVCESDQGPITFTQN